MDNIKKTIGIRINSALANSGKKQKELAAFLGVKDNVVSYFAAGTRTPNTEQIILISNFLNVSTDYLLGKTDIKTADLSIKEICEYTQLSENAIKTLKDYKRVIEKYNKVIEKYEITSEKENQNFNEHLFSKIKKRKNTNDEDCDFIEDELIKAKVYVSMTKDFFDFINLFINFPDAPRLANDFFESIRNYVDSFEYPKNDLTDNLKKGFLDLIKDSELSEYKYQKECMEMLRYARERNIKENNNGND